MTTQPDLNITNPYELDEEQFNAVVDLFKNQAPRRRVAGGCREQIQSISNGNTVGTTWPYQ